MSSTSPVSSSGNALRAIASQPGKVNAQDWLASLEAQLTQGASPLLLDALAHVTDKRFDASLNAIAAVNGTISLSVADITLQQVTA